MQRDLWCKHANIVFKYERCIKYTSLSTSNQSVNGSTIFIIKTIGRNAILLYKNSLNKFQQIIIISLSRIFKFLFRECEITFRFKILPRIKIKIGDILKCNFQLSCFDYSLCFRIIEPNVENTFYILPIYLMDNKITI